MRAYAYVCIRACNVCVAPCTDSCGDQRQASSTILYGSPPFMKMESFTELLPLHHWARWEPETGESPEAPGPASLEYTAANTKLCLRPGGKKTPTPRCSSDLPTHAVTSYAYTHTRTCTHPHAHILHTHTVKINVNQ